MKLELYIEAPKIYVKCELMVSEGEYSFALGRLLKVKTMKNNGKDIRPAKVEPCELQFRPAMVKYTFPALQAGSLYIEYEGGLEGNFLFLQEEIYHFSYYNGWYPAGFHAEADTRYSVRVHMNEAYELINGSFDAAERVWLYSNEGAEIIDCNILLLHKGKYHSVQNGSLSFWYYEESHEAYARRLTEAYGSICQFYFELYGRIDPRRASIVVLPERYHCGAYQRDRLTVFSEMISDVEEKIHGLAHELGHFYGNGADWLSWEDWLNETHAEWSSLLYMNRHHPQAFSKIIQELERNYQGSGLLRPDGDRRPDDVHETGALLYYQIFKEQGSQKIETLLKVFDRLEVKDTAHFLEALEHEDSGLSRFIAEKCRP